jgi:tRNA threonylcarbamoyladenosine biosynthesis protein TsaB
MPLILHIDTATDYGAVGLSLDDTIIASKESESQKEHASFLQPAIAQIIKQSGKSLCDIDALSVTIGPGSYTGLRVGLASAKGLCYALGKPLITVNTLQVMALAAIQTYTATNNNNNQSLLFCPMIDARRMEVFTALYDIECLEKSMPEALIIDENIFSSQLSNHQIVFSGNGSDKMSAICKHPNITVITAHHNISHLALLALKKFQLHQFTEVAYCEPLYLKPFYTTASKK